MKTVFPLDKFASIDTPFYFYDMDLLNETLDEIKRCTQGLPFCVHYAMKANANLEILRAVKEKGFGIDCVSGWELAQALKAGIDSKKIVFAGVAKTDKEIIAGIKAPIQCFNVESLEEMEVINELSATLGSKTRVAIRVNPNVDAHTHAYITTGLNENKFGINLDMLDSVVKRTLAMPNIELVGLHFHIGSQITETEPFVTLCGVINDLVKKVNSLGAKISIINVGGGLGIDYTNPNENPIPDFKSYFEVFKNHLTLSEGQEVHFELGRSIAAQCGSLITRVIYVKHGVNKKFVMVDAGMNDLIRPALYQAHHNIENLTSTSAETETYDVVGPICESSDVFGTGEQLPTTKRGDILALRSAGAYGEIMASQYNCRPIPQAVFQKNIK